MTEHEAVRPGEYTSLPVVRREAAALVLDGGAAGELLLPIVDGQAGAAAGESLRVFIYQSADGSPVPTLARPLAAVGEVAWLAVADVSSVGAFLDWGLPRDVLVPFAEQQQHLRAGQRVLCRIYLDRRGRITGSTRLNRWLADVAEGLSAGDPVSLMVAERTDLGYKMVVDHRFWGLLYHGDGLERLRPGTRLAGYVKQVRTDGRLDLTLARPGGGRDRVNAVAEDILRQLDAAGGRLPYTDKSSPESIRDAFGVSKKVFKQALGSLYKRRLVALDDRGIGRIAS